MINGVLIGECDDIFVNAQLSRVVVHESEETQQVQMSRIVRLSQRYMHAQSSGHVLMRGDMRDRIMSMRHYSNERIEDVI